MTPDDAAGAQVRFNCVCGREMTVLPRRLGSVVRCPDCQRYLRPALHFLLLDPAFAHNLTVQCLCGRFVVEKASRAGKTVVCQACKQRLQMPDPVYREDSDGVIRVPPAVLKRQHRHPSVEKRGRSGRLERLRSASHAGTIMLRPGEHICVNLQCGALLRHGANVCTRCGTNFTTARYYEGPGPKADPTGRWKPPRSVD